MPAINFKRPENVLLLITTVLSFFFFLWGINSWRFSFVGDEWPFYGYAAYFISHPHPVNPLSFSGVYGTHSPMASLYQAFFMYLLGATNFAWRLSNIILIFPLSYFFYRWIRLTFSKGTAVLATIILQASFYLANFFKIGYDNPQSLTLLIICLYLAARFGKAPTKKLGLLLGGILGLSFYSYFGAAFPLFIWPYLIPLYKQWHKSEVKKAVFGFAGMYVLFLLPLLSQIPSLISVFHALGSSKSFAVKNNIIHNFLLFYKNHDYFYNHFVAGPYLDLISQVFCVIGTIIVLIRIRKSPYLFLLLSYLSIVIFIGVTSSGIFTSITRGIFFLPYGFVFTGLGLNTIRESIKGRTASFIFCWIMILAIATVNVYQSQISFFTGKKTGYTGTALILHSLQQNQPTRTPVTLVLSASLTINRYTWMFPLIRKAYGLKDVPFTILRPDELSCSQRIKQSTLLVLNNDPAAIAKLQSFHCTTTRPYTVLSPAIPYY